jgi:hypothetical protein
MVIAGPDPAIHDAFREGTSFVRFLKGSIIMDAWVKPAHDRKEGKAGENE